MLESINSRNRTMFYTEDEKRRRRMAGLPVEDEANTLGDGMSARFPMMMTDHAPSSSPSATFMKDAAVSTTINDAIASIPSELRHKVREATELMQYDGAYASKGINHAEDVKFRLHMMANSASSAGMVTDSDKTAFVRVVDHLQGHIDAARQRLAGGR